MLHALMIFVRFRNSVWLTYPINTYVCSIKLSVGCPANPEFIFLDHMSPLSLQLLLLAALAASRNELHRSEADREALYIEALAAIFLHAPTDLFDDATEGAAASGGSGDTDIGRDAEHGSGGGSGADTDVVVVEQNQQIAVEVAVEQTDGSGGSGVTGSHNVSLAAMQVAVQQEALSLIHI